MKMTSMKVTLFRRVQPLSVTYGLSIWIRSATREFYTLNHPIGAFELHRGLKLLSLRNPFAYLPERWYEEGKPTRWGSGPDSDRDQYVFPHCTLHFVFF